MLSLIILGADDGECEEVAVPAIPGPWANLQPEQEHAECQLVIALPDRPSETSWPTLPSCADLLDDEDAAPLAKVQKPRSKVSYYMGEQQDSKLESSIKLVSSDESEAILKECVGRSSSGRLIPGCD